MGIEIKKIRIHTCDLCGKENNLGDKYESGESTIQFKGSIGSTASSGGHSWDEEKAICLDCTKRMKKVFGEDYIKKLEHYRDSTLGLFCIDRDPKEVSKEWIEENAFQLEQ